jgi:hypothetical protein
VPKKRNYHMYLVRVGKPPVDLWRCDYCGKQGTYNSFRGTDCPHIYPPCKHCGGCEESNECKRDCPGMLGTLASPEVYVAGMVGSKVKA